MPLKPLVSAVPPVLPAVLVYLALGAVGWVGLPVTVGIFGLLLFLKIVRVFLLAPASPVGAL